MRARTAKRGVDVVVDSVGEATWAQSLGALGRRGRLVTCGGTSGPMVTTDVRRLFWNQWSILGSTMGNDAEFDAVVGALPRRPAPCRRSTASIALDDGRAAFERLASGEQFGKVVVHAERVMSDEHAQFEPAEQQAIRDAVAAGEKPRLPARRRDMTTRAIGGGSFGLGYARRREWLICPTLPTKS